MPREYTLKNLAISKNRLIKILKESIEDASQDREQALKAYEYFKKLVEDAPGTGEKDTPGDTAAKAAMIDCLKLAQTSKQNLIKIVDLILKIEASGKNKGDKEEGEHDLHSLLDDMSNDGK